MSAHRLDPYDAENLERVAMDPFANLSTYASDRLYFAGLVSWEMPERRAVLTKKGLRALDKHRFQKEGGK